MIDSESVGRRFNSFRAHRLHRNQDASPSTVGMARPSIVNQNHLTQELAFIVYFVNRAAASANRT